jgi:tight adherence protein C
MTDMLPMLGDPVLLVICLLQAVSAFLMIWSLFRFNVQPEPPVNRRIALALGLGERKTIFEQPVIGTLMSIPLLLAARFPFARVRIRRDLDIIGNPNGYSVEEYLAICISSGISLALFTFLMLWATMGTPMLMALFFMPLLGFFLPLISLKDQADKRMMAMGRKLPYTLDLIGLLMQAGASFTEAIRTLIKDDPDDELNIELKLILAEVEFGTTREEALRKMADRIPLTSLRSVVGAINQAEKLGTPLATILKSQAIGIRQRRSVAAEEASAKASTRILIPTMFILIAVVIIIFGPVIIGYLSGEYEGVGGL